jgi:hypothetical protein
MSSCFRLFTGEFAGKFIWGRGSSDDKCGLIGILYVFAFSPAVVPMPMRMLTLKQRIR